MQGIKHVFHFFACDGLDAADAGSYRTLAQDFHHADAAGGFGMATATEFHAVAELHDAHPVAVFLTEERDGAQFLGLFYRHVAVVLQGQVFADFGIDDAFHFAQLFVGHFLEVGEVEAQVFRGDQ